MTAPESPPEERALPPPLALASGLLMGSADAVPGVSGGTIALIIGIYERFIGALATVVRAPKLIGSREGRHELGQALWLLVPIGIGVGIAYFVVTLVLVGPTDKPGWLRKPDTAPMCYGFFFGLVLLSLGEPWRRIRSISPGCWIAAAIAAVGAAWFVGLPYATTTPATWQLVYGGALAISVMLLPGVSGSLLLVILGQYTTVASAAHDLDFTRLGAVLLGILLGLALFVPLLRKLLRRHHDLTMAALTGLMAGSLRALWPWKSGYELKASRLDNIGIGDDWPWVLLAAAVGALCVRGLAMLERRIDARLGKVRAEER